MISTLEAHQLLLRLFLLHCPTPSLPYALTPPLPHSPTPPLPYSSTLLLVLFSLHPIFSSMNIYY